MEIKKLNQLLSSQFKMKDLGPLRYFLGLEIDKKFDGIFVSQRKYTIDLLKDYGMLDVKPLKLPMDIHIKLALDKSDLLPNLVLYQQFLGKLIYLTITRHDISFSVQLLNQFMHCPTTAHM